MPKPGYEFLQHTTDAYVSATGTSLEQAFEFAGIALFDVMCEVKSIVPKLREEVRVAGHDEVSLLYNWLESLLLKFELEGKVYSKFEVRPIKKIPDGYQAKAALSGEKYDRKKHGAKVEVKAVTYHKMNVQREDSMLTVTFILDL